MYANLWADSGTLRGDFLFAARHEARNRTNTSEALPGVQFSFGWPSAEALMYVYPIVSRGVYVPSSLLPISGLNKLLKTSGSDSSLMFSTHHRQTTVGDRETCPHSSESTTQGRLNRYQSTSYYSRLFFPSLSFGSSHQAHYPFPVRVFSIALDPPTTLLFRPPHSSACDMPNWYIRIGVFFVLCQCQWDWCHQAAS